MSGRAAWWSHQVRPCPPPPVRAIPQHPARSDDVWRRHPHPQSRCALSAGWSLHGTTRRHQTARPSRRPRRRRRAMTKDRTERLEAPPRTGRRGRRRPHGMARRRWAPPGKMTSSEYLRSNRRRTPSTSISVTSIPVKSRSNLLNSVSAVALVRRRCLATSPNSGLLRGRARSEPPGSRLSQADRVVTVAVLGAGDNRSVGRCGRSRALDPSRGRSSGRSRGRGNSRHHRRSVRGDRSPPASSRRRSTRPGRGRVPVGQRLDDHGWSSRTRLRSVTVRGPRDRGRWRTDEPSRRRHPTHRGRRRYVARGAWS